MNHSIDWSRPAKLIRGDRVSEFGEGYRQVSGPVLAEGSVDELLEKARMLSGPDAGKAFICNEGGVPLPVAEVRRRAEDRS